LPFGQYGQVVGLRKIQKKSFRARTKSAEYERKTKFWYDKKNQAIQLLYQSLYAHLMFYSPASPNKITHLEFCSQHFQQWKFEQKNMFAYSNYGKWDFFRDNRKHI
jgi:hypothetical protein